MKYPDIKCDYSGVVGANHTEPITIDGEVHEAYFSDEAWNIMQQLSGRLRTNDQSAESEITAFWAKVHEKVYFRTTTKHA